MKKLLLQVLQAKTARSWLNCCWRRGTTSTARSAVRQPTSANVSPIWKANRISTCTTPTSATR